jgi:hypothetical protein
MFLSIFNFWAVQMYAFERSDYSLVMKLVVNATRRRGDGKSIAPGDQTPSRGLRLNFRPWRRQKKRDGKRSNNFCSSAMAIAATTLSSDRPMHHD